jgi:uncharacterized membrane protein YqjE
MEQSQSSEPPIQSSPDTASFDLIDTVRVLRSAGNALFAQLVLHAQLARVELATEKNRLFQMFVIALIGFACLLCILLFTGAMLMLFTWDTAYRIPAVIALIVFYVICVCLAWYRLHVLSARSDLAFAASCEEFAADIDLIRSKL